MKIQPPVKTSVDSFTVDVQEIEPFLQCPAMDMKPWPEATITLKDGRTLYIRAMVEDDVPQMLGFMEKVMKEELDFYDIVGVRVYAEILGWKRKRMKDAFTLLGLVDGEMIGFANGRVMTEDVAVSLHTMAFSRRGRVGWAMYYAKTFYALEILKAKEWWSTFESYNGWRMAGLEMAQPTKPWPEIQHELGGATVFYLNQASWKGRVKDYAKQMIGADLNFNVTDEIRKANANFHVPEKFVP